MTISIRWYNPEKTIILWERHDQTTWDDLHLKYNDVYTMLDSVNHPVDIIFYSRVSSVPSNALPYLTRLLEREHPNERMRVIVNASSHLMRLLDILMIRRADKTDKVYFVKTLEEAVALIRKVREYNGI